MKPIQFFETADGRHFESEVQAEEWETRLRLTAKANAMLHAGASLWDAYRCMDVTVNDGNHDALREMTVRVPFRVRHWPDGGAAVYRVVALLPDGNVLVHGNAVFAEGYGGVLSRAELVRCGEVAVIPHLAVAA